jgi:hypothetical protein
MAAQRQLSAAPLAGVCTGTADGTAPLPTIAPSPGAAPAASAAKPCWAAGMRITNWNRRRVTGHGGGGRTNRDRRGFDRAQRWLAEHIGIARVRPGTALAGRTRPNRRGFDRARRWLAHESGSHGCDCGTAVAGTRVGIAPALPPARQPLAHESVPVSTGHGGRWPNTSGSHRWAGARRGLAACMRRNHGCATGTAHPAAQRRASVAPLAGVKTGTDVGTRPAVEIAPSPGAAPAASTARNVGRPRGHRTGFYCVVVLKMTRQHKRFLPLLRVRFSHYRWKRLSAIFDNSTLFLLITVTYSMYRCKRLSTILDNSTLLLLSTVTYSMYRCKRLSTILDNSTLLLLIMVTYSMCRWKRLSTILDNSTLLLLIITTTRFVIPSEARNLTGMPQKTLRLRLRLRSG